MSASDAVEPPRGGIAPLPLMALAVRPSMPCAMRGAHAALSPSFGAPAMPAVWQAVQICVNSAGGPLVASAFAGSAAATVATGVAANGATAAATTGAAGAAAEAAAATVASGVDA